MNFKTKIAIAAVGGIFTLGLTLSQIPKSASVDPYGAIHVEYYLGATTFYDTERYQNHSFWETPEPQDARAELASVKEVDSGNVIVETKDGNMFGFIGDGYSTGDDVVIVLSGNNTPQIYDDSIVEVRGI